MDNNNTKNDTRKPIVTILVVAMIACVLAVTVATVSAEDTTGYHGGNELLELYIGETGTGSDNPDNFWLYKGDGQLSCTLEIYSIWYDDGIHRSYDFQVIDYFGMDYNDPDTTAILETPDGNIEVRRTVYIPSGSERYFTISYTLTNTGSETLTGVRFFELVDYDIPYYPYGDNDNAWYDPENDFVWVEDQGYFKNGFTGSNRSSNHGIDVYDTMMLTGDQDGELNGVTSMTGDVAVGLQYNIGELKPGPEAAWEITMTFWFGEPYPIGPVDNPTSPAEVLAIGPIPATVVIEPETLNLKSKGKWITAYIIELSDGYVVGDIDIESVQLLYDGKSVGAEWGEVQDDGRLMVKFDRSEVTEILEVGEEVDITVTGKTDETEFEGSDTIRVIDKGGKNSDSDSGEVRKNSDSGKAGKNSNHDSDSGKAGKNSDSGKGGKK
ncbi:MAG: hypothetical protein IBX41_01650 [Methanophagales archaeon]|nr:hypothetical protein [Methanophagales archaeon]